MCKHQTFPMLFIKTSSLRHCKHLLLIFKKKCTFKKRNSRQEFRQLYCENSNFLSESSNRAGQVAMTYGRYFSENVLGPGSRLDLGLEPVTGPVWGTFPVICGSRWLVLALVLIIFGSSHGFGEFLHRTQSQQCSPGPGFCFGCFPAY